MGFKFYNKCLILLLALVGIVIYAVLVPCAVYNIKYVPVSEFVNDISVARHGTDTGTQLPFCPTIPPNLDVLVSLNESENLPLDQLKDIHPGGWWKPKECVSRHVVAIIVPYKNRDRQLRVFLYHIHSYLRKQLLEYRVFIIEQTSNKPFNRGALFNVGFKESLKFGPFHCFIFHDVDLIPLNNLNMYACSSQPRHLSVSINIFRYALIYDKLFGGVTAMTKSQFEDVNGFSNIFFGWGGEDDDLAKRIFNRDMKITRWDPRICRYHMLHHKKASPNTERQSLLQDSNSRYNADGLVDLNYQIVDNETRHFYTWFLIDF